MTQRKNLYPGKTPADSNERNTRKPSIWTPRSFTNDSFAETEVLVAKSNQIRSTIHPRMRHMPTNENQYTSHTTGHPSDQI